MVDKGRLVVKRFELASRDKEAVLEFVNQLVARYPDQLVGVILFGSKARGDETAESDIDLLLIFSHLDEAVDANVSAIADDMMLLRGVVLMPKLYDLSWWQNMADGPYPFFNDIFKDGLPVYGEPAIFTPLVHRDVPPLYETAVTA